MQDDDRHLILSIALIAGLLLATSVLWPALEREPTFHPLIWPGIAAVTAWGFWRATRRGGTR